MCHFLFLNIILNPVSFKLYFLFLPFFLYVSLYSDSLFLSFSQIFILSLSLFLSVCLSLSISLYPSLYLSSLSLSPSLCLSSTLVSYFVLFVLLIFFRPCLYLSISLFCLNYISANLSFSACTIPHSELVFSPLKKEKKEREQHSK